MLLKITLKYHYTSMRMAKIKKTLPHVIKNLEYLEVSYTPGVNIR